MGRIIATEHSSLDGVVDAPGPGDVGDKAWISDFDRGETGDGYTLDEALASEVLLLGLHPTHGSAPDRMNAPHGPATTDAIGAAVRSYRTTTKPTRRDLRP